MQLERPWHCCCALRPLARPGDNVEQAAFLLGILGHNAKLASLHTLSIDKSVVISRQAIGPRNAIQRLILRIAHEWCSSAFALSVTP